MKSRAKPSATYRFGAIGIALLGATLGGQALAQPVMGGYIGGNIGRASADFDPPPLVVPPAAVIGTTDDDRDTAYKLYGGYRFHPNFAVEGGFFDLGRYDYGYTTAAGTTRGSTRFQGLNLDLVGILPLGDRFSAFGRIGAAYTRARSSVGATGGLPLLGAGRSDNDWGPKVGLGIEYAITRALAVRGEWERYRLDDPIRGRGDVDMASIGLVWRFGAPVVTPVVAPAPAPAPRVVPAPAPRVLPPPPPPPMAAPAPAPIVVPAPAPAPRPYRN